MQTVTGVILAFYYKPDPESAYESIQLITHDLTLGWLVRGMHRWGASVFIILMFFHMARVFLYGSYKYPRELTWIVGVLLLVMGMMEGFTGYLLPWDQTAYWATVVGINLNGTAPFLGPFIAQFLSGGARSGRKRSPSSTRCTCCVAARRDHRPDRAAPVPRDPARRQLAAVVEGRGRHGAPAGRARGPRTGLVAPRAAPW